MWRIIIGNDIQIQDSDIDTNPNGPWPQLRETRKAIPFIPIFFFSSSRIILEKIYRICVGKKNK